MINSGTDFSYTEHVLIAKDKLSSSLSSSSGLKATKQQHNASLVLVVKHNVSYITSHLSIKVLQQPQLLVGMPKLA